MGLGGARKSITIGGKTNIEPISPNTPATTLSQRNLRDIPIVSCRRNQFLDRHSRLGVGIISMRILGAEGDAAFCAADEIHHLDYFRS